jgi:hypothetical protein
MTDKPLPDQEREAIARLMHRDGCDHSRETMIAWECRREADRLLDAGLRLDAARVAAPSDGEDAPNAWLHEHHPSRFAAPSDGPCGEKNHPGSHPCNAPKGHEPGPEQGGHYCRYEWRVAVPPDGLDEAPEWYRRGWAEGHAAALAATEQPETDE